MRHGIVAARCGIGELIDTLNVLAGTLIPQELRGPLEDLPLGDSDEGWMLAAGEHGGAAYVLDTSMYLSSLPDVVVAASNALDALVVACGADVLGGASWLYAASDGELARGFCDDAFAREPWAKGDPLPSEAARPLDRRDGSGVRAGLDALGFDVDGWLARSDLRSVRYLQREPALFDVAHVLNDEVEAHLQARRRTR